MTDNARKFETIDDLLALPDATSADLIDGHIEIRAEPSFTHEDHIGGILFELRTHFRGPKRPGSKGGWWLITNTLIRFSDGQALCPDLAGWKRERVPQKPHEHPVSVRPDWVCEVSVSSRRKDSVIVPRILAANGVPWYWRVDVETANLLVYELTAEGYVQRASLFREDGRVRIPPFDAVELSVPELFGDDPEDLGEISGRD